MQGSSLIGVDSSCHQASLTLTGCFEAVLPGRTCVGIACERFAAMVGGVAQMPGLIAHPGQLWLMAEPVDMRRGINGLSMMVQQILKRSPCGGYPAENWQLIRATNPIESAQKKWFRLKVYSLLVDVINDVKFVSGIKQTADQKQNAA